MPTCVGRDGDLSPTAQRRWTDIPKNPSPSWKFTQCKTPFATTRPCNSSSSTLWWQKTRSSRMQSSTRHLWPSSTRNIEWSTAARPATSSLGQCVTTSAGVISCHFLPRCHRALQGWKRRTPPRSRDPHVWCIWTVLILEFLRQGHWSMGIYMLWMVTCYLRPGEPLSIQRGDIKIPLHGISSRHQVLLSPEDRPLRSKTYAVNDTVELYCPGAQHLSAMETPRNASSALVIATSW